MFDDLGRGVLENAWNHPIPDLLFSTILIIIPIIRKKPNKCENLIMNFS